ncbi:MAG: glycoside hydrolase family 13 protein [Clostridia bacterium]|nr:glycoside hydrolase family 13 protein [Clostridia bacterium]
MQLFVFNPIDVNHKSIVGAISAEEKVTITIGVLRSLAIDNIRYLVHQDGGYDTAIAMVKSYTNGQYDYYSVDIELPRGLYWYCFEVDRQGMRAKVGLGVNRQAQLSYDNPNYYQLLVYQQQYDSPQWLGQGIMYHIFVDRFCSHKCGPTVRDGQVAKEWNQTPTHYNQYGQALCNDFYGGDLLGIESKLDYLCSLGVTCLYLSPIFTANSNHKYDTADYMTIDSAFGTEQDFVSLCQHAKSKGIHIVLDGVFNHTGADSIYFNKYGHYNSLGAYQSNHSPYYDWYTFNNQDRSKYASWWGIDNLPAHNANSPSLQEFIAGTDGVVAKWLKLGADGWRLDVVDEINDNMLDRIVYRAKCVTPDSAIIGEVWEDATNKISYGVRRRYFQGAQLDSVMNYQLKNAIIDYVRNGNTGALSNIMYEFTNNYPSFALDNLMNIIDSHDTPRALTALYDTIYDSRTDDTQYADRVISGDRYYQARELLKMAVVLQYTLVGFPSIFYGDEAGLSGYSDPYCRRCYPWGNEDNQLIDFYRHLATIRRLPCFHGGQFTQLVADDGLYVYTRSVVGCTVLVLLSTSYHTYTLDGQYLDLSSDCVCQGDITLSPNSYMILRKL